ncbi:MAG: TolC family protein, partial [Muribaculaceae bacterium]|nr:TolC family protein [Muribaculaceae bacterium]
AYGYPGADIFKSMRTGHPDFGVMAGVSLQWEIGAFYNRSERLHRINDQRHLIDIERQIADFNKSMASESIVGEIRALRSAIEHDAKIAELRTKVRQAAESQLANGVIDTTSLLDKITDEQTAILSRNVHIIRLLQQYYLLNHTLNK